MEIDFIAPASAKAAHQAVIVTVFYEIYTGIPVLSKWVRVANQGEAAVTVTSLTTDILYPTNEAVG